MPQYRYAYNRFDALTDVLSLSRTEGSESEVALLGPFRCAGCEAEVIAKVRGEKKEKHFAHKARTTCSEETYLHRLAKQTFHDVYTNCLEENEPFVITLVHPQVCTKLEPYLERRCQRGTVEKPYDLTTYYDTIALERRDGEFVPDVLLSDSKNKNGKVYVEIAVTHFLSERKRDADARIIEIPIEKEADVEKIRACNLGEADASFINFPRHPARVPDASCSCDFETFYCLFIYPNGRSVLEWGTMRELRSAYQRNHENLAYVELVTKPSTAVHQSPGKLFKHLLSEATERGFPARNCLLCRYAGHGNDSFSGKPIFCKYKRKHCTSNAAVDCAAYRPQNRTDQ